MEYQLNILGARPARRTARGPSAGASSGRRWARRPRGRDRRRWSPPESTAGSPGWRVSQPAAGGGAPPSKGLARESGARGSRCEACVATRGPAVPYLQVVHQSARGEGSKAGQGRGGERTEEGVAQPRGQQGQKQQTEGPAGARVAHGHKAAAGRAPRGEQLRALRCGGVGGLGPGRCLAQRRLVSDDARARPWTEVRPGTGFGSCRVTATLSVSLCRERLSKSQRATLCQTLAAPPPSPSPAPQRGSAATPFSSSCARFQFIGSAGSAQCCCADGTPSKRGQA